MAARKDPNIGGILLAAGSSTRFGSPKQLAKFEDRSLIRRAAETLVNSKCDPIIVVLGAEIERSTAELVGLDINICINKNWQTGMASSIIAGLNSLTDISLDLDAVIITLCDQPHVTSDDLNKLIAAFHESRSPIVAAQYGDSLGVPALFSKEMFTELFQLDGDKGARQLIRQKAEHVEHAWIEKAAIDVDTVDNLGSLTK